MSSSAIECSREVFRPIRYKPLPSQWRFHNSNARFKGFSGPIGSGKSAAIVQEALKLSVENAGLPGLIGAPTYSMLRDATQKAWFEVLDENSIPYEFWKSENRVVLKDFGSEVWFRSLDNPDRLRGTNLAWFCVDELTYAEEDAWLRLLGRLRHPASQRLCGFASWTPKGYDWVYRSFIGPNKKSGYEAILAEPRENKYLPADFYDELAKSYDPKFFEQEVLGSYLSLSGNRVYYAFDRAASLRPLDIVPNGEICWTLDFNVNPMSSVIAQVEDMTSRMDTLTGKRNARLNVVDEIVLPESDLYQVCGEFKRRTERYTSRGQLTVHVYGDPAGNSRSHAGPSSWRIVTECFANDTRYRLVNHVPLAHPAVKERVNAMNAMLLNHSGERRMFIDPRCKELIADLEEVAWREDASGNQTAELDKRNPKRTHVSDALGYLVEAEFGLKQKGAARPGSVF